MRSAGSGDGLWGRHVAFLREQEGRRGQIYRGAGQDLDEPLHPVHALRSLCDRSRGRSGTGRHRPRRGHGDHLLSRAGAHFRAAGQRRRPLSGRRPDLEADGLPRPAVGIRQDRVGRRHGCAGLCDSRGLARTRDRAHLAARQRRHQRGMDFRQNAAYCRRIEDAAARSSICACRRPAQARELGGGLHRGRRESRGGFAVPGRRDRRRPGDGRRNVRAQIAFRQAWLGQHRLPAGWLEIASKIRARVLSFQFDDRWRRPSGRHFHRRLEPAPRGGGSQRAHPQAVAQGRRADRRDRRQGRSDVRLPLPRGRTGHASASL